MKILCVIDSLGSGGAQRQIVNIAKGLKRRGNNVSFLVYHEENFYLDDLEKMDIPCNIIQSSSYIFRIIKIRNFIRSGNFESILSFLEGANFMVTLAGFPFRKWRLILGERNANPNILNSKKLRMYRWFHFFCDKIVSNSQANLDMVMKINPLLDRKKMKVIYNAVDLNEWCPSDDYIPLKNRKINILIGATHEERKNASGMLQALNNLSPIELSKINIEWYGRFDKSYEETIRMTEEFKLQDVVSYYPATKEIKNKIIEADVIGLFSTYEGLPNIVCEAMSMGKPIMASAISDLPKILEETENILFSPLKTEEIVKAFKNLVNMPKEKLIEIGVSNRVIAEQLFDPENSYEKYFLLLNDEL